MAPHHPSLPPSLQAYIQPNQVLILAGFGATLPGGVGGKLNVAPLSFVSDPDPVTYPGRTTQMLAGGWVGGVSKCCSSPSAGSGNQSRD